MIPALSDVGATSLLADRMEAKFPQEVVEPDVILPTWRLDLEPGRFALDLDDLGGCGCPCGASGPQQLNQLGCHACSGRLGIPVNWDRVMQGIGSRRPHPWP